MVEEFGMSVFLELVVKNINKLKKNVEDAIKKVGIDVDFKGGGGAAAGGKGDGKKQSGLLTGILGKVAGIAALLLSLKPITDLVKLIVSFVFFILLKIIKDIAEWISELPQIAKDIWTIIKDTATRTWEFLKEIPSRIWEFLKALPGQIWGLLVSGFDFVVNTLGTVKDKIVEWLKLLGGAIGNLAKSR